MSDASVYLVYSGGVSNTDPKKSIGGPASTAASGTPTSQRLQLISGSIPGVTPVGSYGIDPSTCTIDWDPATSNMTVTDGLSSSASISLAGTSGYKKFASSLGVLLFRLTSNLLSASPASATYAVRRYNQNVFDDVAISERSANHVNYRALYLKNESTSPILNTTVTLSAQPTHGSISLVTEYLDTDMSDGLTTGLATAIVGESDTTDVLLALPEVSSLTWPTIGAGDYVTFWVKRSILSGSSGVAVVQEDFNIQLFYTR